MLRYIKVLILPYFLFIAQQTAAQQPPVALSHTITLTGFNGYINKITVVYTIKNNGSDKLENIVLTDNYTQMFGTEATASTFAKTLTTVPAGNGITLNPAYQGGSDNLLQTGSFLDSADEAKITVTFEVELTSKYKGDQFNSNARLACDGFTFPVLSVAALNLCQITIEKVNGLSLSQTGTAIVSTAEKDQETLVFVITRKGMTTKETRVSYSFTPSASRPAANRATMPGDISWISSQTGTIIFPKDNTNPQTVSIKIVDDLIYELLEYFDLTLTPVAAYPEASILQRKVETEILSDDAKPVVTVEQAGPKTIIEGNGGAAVSTLVPIRVSISNASYLPVTVSWSISAVGTNNFNAPTSGTITFAANTTDLQQTFNILVSQDELEESDYPFKVNFTATNAETVINNAPLSYTIKDDDMRRIIWNTQSPGLYFKKMDAGSEIVDTMYINFLVTDATLKNPKVHIILPAGVTPITTYLTNIHDESTVKGVKFASWTASTRTLIYDLVGNGDLKAGDMVHFKIIRKAECTATLGAVKDIVKVEATNVAAQPWVKDGLVTNKQEWEVPHTINKGKLSLTIKAGDLLMYENEGDLRDQKLEVMNSGQGSMKNCTIRIAFPKEIVEMTALTIGTTVIGTLPTRQLSGTESFYDIILSGTLLGSDQLLTAGEKINITYTLKGGQKKNVGCGLKYEKISAWWGCSTSAKPDATVPATIELYRPEGVPQLTRTLIPPTGELNESGVNIYKMELKNEGQSDAYYTNIPITIYSYKTDKLGSGASDVVVTLSAGTPTYTLAARTDRGVTVTNLIIPAGETATIEYKITRNVLDRYSGSPNANVLNEDYFLHIRSEKITYSDECNENPGSIDVGYFTQNAGSVNVSHLPIIKPTHFDMLFAKKFGTWSFEFGTANTVFPMAETKGFFGPNDNGAGKKVVINFDLSTNKFLPQEIKITAADGTSYNQTNGILVSWTASGAVPKNQTNLPVSNVNDAAPDGKYTVTIPFNIAKLCSAGARFDFKVKGDDCSAGNEFSVKYTVDFVTKAGKVHKLYQVTGVTAIKCANEAGANLKDWDDPNSIYIQMNRLSLGMRDNNNNGLENAGDAMSTNTSGMRLDRFYHGDTLEFVYKIRTKNDPNSNVTASDGISTPWEYLYVTLDKMSQKRFTHLESSYNVYIGPDQAVNPGQPRPNGSGPATPQYIPSTDSVYFRLNPASKFNEMDSVVFRTRWLVQTMTMNTGANGTNSTRIEENHMVKHWVYCWHAVRNTNDIFRPFTNSDFAVPTDYGLMQKYERGSSSIQLYSLSHGTNGIFGGGGSGYMFDKYYISQNTEYDYFEVFGLHATNDAVPIFFPYELRKPHYIDSISFMIPYGYRLTQNVQLFGNSGLARMQYATAGTPYNGFVSVIAPNPQMQGFKQKLIFNNWHKNPYTQHTPGTDYQIPDESWGSRPFMRLELTPKAPYGEYTVYIKTNYGSTKDYPSNLGIPKLESKNSIGFKIRNTAPTFLLSCVPNTVQARGDTVQWTIRIENKSSDKINGTAKSGYLYMGNMNDVYGAGSFDLDIEACELLNETGNRFNPNKKGEGFGNRWIYVGDLPAATTKIYRFTAVIKNWAGHCDKDSLFLTPWFDCENDGSVPNLSNSPAGACDTTYDRHVGRSVNIYMEHQPAHLAGEVTALYQTPTDPSVPGSAKFGSDEIQAGTPFPVEIKLSSTDIISVKNAQIEMLLPAGMTYVSGTAYYETGGSNQPFVKDGSNKDALDRNVDGSGTPFTLIMTDITGQPLILEGLTQNDTTKRDIYLRFKLTTDCSFNADSAIIKAHIDGQHLCDASAMYHNNPDTIQGLQIYLEGYRYYILTDAIYGPQGYTFALCEDGKKKKTLRGQFTRQGRALQNDYFELKMPGYFSLDPEPSPGKSVIKYFSWNPDDPMAIPPLVIDSVSEDPIIITKSADADTIIYRWKLPVVYSAKTTQNLLVEYNIPVILNDLAPNIKLDNPFVLNIVADKTNQCSGKGALLATDTLMAQVYINEVGLAKRVSKVLNADQYFTVTYTYTLVNLSNVPVYNVTLTDNLASMFGGMIDFKAGSFSIDTTNASGLKANDGYAGNGAVIYAGTMAAGETKTVVLTFDARPNMTYDGRTFENNAKLTASNTENCETFDISTDSQNDDPGTPPAAFADPTPISFNSLRFKDIGPITVQENVGTMTLTIERVGDLSAYDFYFLLADKSDLGGYLPISFYNEATVGSSPDGCTDAWRDPEKEKLTFPAGKSEMTVQVHIVDDNIDETPLIDNISEAFAAIITHVSMPDDVSFINDTLIVVIEDNDMLPTLSIWAMADSIRERTIILGPGHNYGTNDMKFELRLSNPTINYATIKANWQTENGSGLAVGGSAGIQGVDFDYYEQLAAAIPAFTLGCIATDTIQTITVKVVADSIPETAKKVKVSLSGVQGIIPGTLEAYSTIVDDDIKIDTIKLKNLICKGDGTGEITVKARGGETYASGGKYHYRWTGPGGFNAYEFTSGNNAIQNLQAGFYAVTVTDVWSTPTDSSFIIEVKEPTLPLAVHVDSKQDVTCNGGNDGLINTTVSGGWNVVLPYDIKWTKKDDVGYSSTSDDINTLTAGLYRITVKDSVSCVVKDSVEIKEPLPLGIDNTVVRDITCKGSSDGSIEITIVGGNPFPTPNDPYLIFWTGPSINAGNNNKTSISGLLPGTYTVVISDNGCGTITDFFTIKEPATLMTASVESITDVACKGDASGIAVIKAEGGWGKYTYAWSDGITTDNNTRNDLKAGDYSVLVTDSAGCTKNLSPVTIGEPAERMKVTLTATDETYQNGNDGTITVDVTGGVPAYIYSWADAPTLNTAFRNFLEAGTYTVTVTDQQNCVMSESAVINEPNTTDNLPNVFTPDGDGFNDKLLEYHHIKVFDRWGLLLYDGTDGWDGRYKGKMMPSGTYFYVLIDDTTGKEYKSSVLLQILK